MNLIICSQDCRHQQEGYCALNDVTRLSGNPQSKCGYYQSGQSPGGASGEEAAEPLSFKYTV